MSKILMWYRGDFGSDDAAVITAVAGYVHVKVTGLEINISLPIRFRYLADKTDADYLTANAAKLKLQFKNYDWSTFAVDPK